MSRARKVSAAQTSVFGAGGGDGNSAVHPPKSAAVPPEVVTRSDAPNYTGPGHGMFLELLGRVERGDRHVREDLCRKCGQRTPHEYVCLQPRGPRVWGFVCTHCRRDRHAMDEDA